MRDLSFYEDALKKKEPFTVNFVGVDNDNLLFWLEESDESGRVRVELPMTDYWGNYTKERKKNFHVENVLSNDVSVIVTDVDREKNLVTVSAAEARKILRVREREDLERRLKAGEDIKLVGRVVALKGVGWGSFAVVRPVKMNIVLMLPVAWYSPEFVNDIKDVCQVGAPVEVKLVPKEGSGYKKTAAYDFLCSRRELLPDPWDNVTGKIRVDDVVTVLVTGARKKGKNPASPSVSDQTDLACVIEGLGVNAYVGVRSNLRLEPHHRYYALVNSVDIPHKRIRLIAYRHKNVNEK